MCDVCLQNPCDSRCPNNDEEPVYICDICDAEIYSGDEYYDISDVVICTDCIKEYRRLA